jgi:lipopolysaccharide cholinephosphotransferase
MTDNQIRERQLKLFSRLKEFCNQQGIQYYAFAGTLLGAVRHKGFIPWDNDIDIAVSREDYKKMQRILNTEESNKYFRFLCYENDPEYLWQHGRIVDKKTYMKTARGYTKLGVSIDIFPLDNQGDTEEEAMLNLKEIQRCVQLRIMSYDKKYKTWKYPDCSEEEKCILKNRFEIEGLDDEAYWVKRHIQLAQKFNDVKSCRYYGCNSNDKYTVIGEKKQYEDVEYLDFEDMKIPVPIGYDEILKRYYGNYMDVPSKEKQKGIKEMEIYLL